jgi:nucleoid-associated protein YgaU
MTSGRKLGLTAVVVLGVAVIGYAVFFLPGDDDDQAVSVAVDSDKIAIPVSPVAQPSSDDPSVTPSQPSPLSSWRSDRTPSTSSPTRSSAPKSRSTDTTTGARVPGISQPLTDSSPDRAPASVASPAADDADGATAAEDDSTDPATPLAGATESALPADDTAAADGSPSSRQPRRRTSSILDAPVWSSDDDDVGTDQADELSTTSSRTAPPAPRAEPSTTAALPTTEGSTPSDTSSAAASNTARNVLEALNAGRAARSATPRTYTVQEDDNLWSIAQRLYGDGSKWRQIAEANPDIDPARIKPGDVLNLPGNAAPAPARSTREDPLGLGLSEEEVRWVTVQEGDTLWDIAQRVYGDGTKANLIYEANRNRMPSPDTVRAGVRLVVPHVD